MIDDLKVLLLNVGKRRQVQLSFLNDEKVKDFAALATVEPYIYRDPTTDKATVTPSAHWHMIKPSIERDDRHQRHSFRALLWVNKRLRTRQVPILSYDIAAAEIRTSAGHVLLCAVYDPKDGADVQIRQQEVEDRLQAIERAWKAFQDEHGEDRTSLLIAADLNRHHPLWGGPQVTRIPHYNNDGEEVISFIVENALRSLLPAGTITWQHQSGQLQSTPDLGLASGKLTDALVLCRVYGTDHGSDHRAVEAHFRLSPCHERTRKRRRVYDKADWPTVRETL